MDQTICKKCRTTFLSSEKKCPLCGTKVKHYKDKLSLWLAGIIIVIFFSVIFSAPNTPEISESPTKAFTITKDQYFGCKSIEDYNRILDYVRVKDFEAYKSALSKSLRSNQCTTFTKGTIVFKTDTSIYYELVRLRKKGQTNEYWITTEAIR